MKRVFKKLVHKDVGQAESRNQLTTSSSTPTVDTNFPDGFLTLKECLDATVDICFVHGLTGNRLSTWTAAGQLRPWPETLLPSEVPKARILTYGYDAYVVRMGVTSSNGLQEHATNLLADLTDFRVNCPSRPLIFVAHSLGGLVCKRAILLSQNNAENHLRTLFSAVKGIIFMGTPHQGSWIADWSKIPTRALGVLKSTNSSLLRVLRTDDEFLKTVQSDFLNMVRYLPEHQSRQLNITCFYEELGLPMVGKVVSEASATFPGYPLRSIHADHSNMVKFASSQDTGFQRVLAELRRWESEVSALSFADVNFARHGQQVIPRQDAHFIHSSHSSLAEASGIVNPEDAIPKTHAPLDPIQTALELFQLPDKPWTREKVPELLKALQLETYMHSLANYQVNSSQSFQDKKVELEQQIKDKFCEAVKRALKSFSFSEMGYREAIIERPTQNTCEWIYQDESYCRWEGTPNSLLWIKGKPGAGKSVLMKSLCNHRKLNAPGTTILLEFFFNARGALMEKTPSGLYSTMICSLVNRDPEYKCELLLRFLKKEFQSDTSKVVVWHLAEMADIFHWQIAQRQEYGIEILIDALDECNEDDVREVVRRFEKTIEAAHASGASLRVCWSSRYYPNIKMSSKYGAELRLDVNNDADIYMYVEQDFPEGSDAVLNSIRQDLLSRANGVFLWVILVTRLLRKAVDAGQNPSDLKRLLNSLPQELDDLLYDIFAQAQSTMEEREELTRLAQWIFCSVHALSLQELYIAWQIQSQKIQYRITSLETSAVALYRFQKRVNHVSGGLFETVYDGSEDNDHSKGPMDLKPIKLEHRQEWGDGRFGSTRVQAIHESVREFFLGPRGLSLLSASSMESFLELGFKEVSVTCSKALLATEFWPVTIASNLESIVSVDEILETITLAGCSPPLPDARIFRFWQSFLVEHFEHVISLSKTSTNNSVLGPIYLRKLVVGSICRVYYFAGMKRVFPFPDLKAVISNSIFGFDVEESQKLALALHNISAALYLFHRMGIKRVDDLNSSAHENFGEEMCIIASLGVYNGNPDGRHQVEDCGLYLAGQLQQPPSKPKLEFILNIVFTIRPHRGQYFKWSRFCTDGDFAVVTRWKIIDQIGQLPLSDRTRRRWEELPLQQHQSHATSYFNRFYLVFEVNRQATFAVSSRGDTDPIIPMSECNEEELLPLKLVTSESQWGPYWWSQWVSMSDRIVG